VLLAQSRLAVPFQPQLGTAIIIATTIIATTATIITTVTIIATTPTIRGTTITATTRGIGNKKEKNFEAASRAAFFFHFIYVSRWGIRRADVVPQAPTPCVFLLISVF
jgi:hypothetical protein